jgi:hypothetical protein
VCLLCYYFQACSSSHAGKQKPDEMNKPKTRSNTNIWLVGPTNDRIQQNSRLPTLRDTLSVFFYHHKEEKRTLKDSARLTVSEVCGFWKKAGIPTALSYDVEKRILKTHAEWQCLKKTINRRTQKQISNESQFCSNLDKLFDIAHQDAQQRTELPEDLQFLASQREGMKGYMAGEDKVWTEKQEQKAKRKELADKYKQKQQEGVELLTSCTSSSAKFWSDSSSSTCDDASDDIDEATDSDIHLEPILSRKCKVSAVKTSNTEKKALLATDALYRSKVTDR